jgi:uncharacterized protein YehS (DUF1456 family)
MRAVRYTLHLKNREVLEILQSEGEDVTAEEVVNLLKNDTAEDFIEASPSILHSFLDGVITKLRGKKDGPKPYINKSVINNNIILRKLRIAFNLKDTDVIDILKLANFRLSKSELGAMSRKHTHPNYTKCGDQVIRYFLKGLTIRFREETK